MTYLIEPVLHDPDEAVGWLLSAQDGTDNPPIRRFFADHEGLLSVLGEALAAEEAESLRRKKPRKAA